MNEKTLVRNKFLLFKIIIAIGVQTGLWSAFYNYVPLTDSIPYNVREMVGQTNQITFVFLISVSCYLILGFPIYIANHLVRIKNTLHYILLLFFILSASSISVLCLIACVPMECLHDILGSQVLGWLWYWEILYRFSGIFSGILGISIFAFFVTEFRFEKQIHPMKNITYLIVAIVLMFYTHWVVVINAGTDNLIELMARGGDWKSSTFLVMWFFTIIFSASVVGKNVIKKSDSIIIVTILVILMIPIGFIFLQYGTTSALTKYGKTFSALQFLLSPDRANYLQGPVIFVRYCVAHAVIAFLICINQIPFWGVSCWKRKNR